MAQQFSGKAKFPVVKEARSSAVWYIADQMHFTTIDTSTDGEHKDIIMVRE